MNFRAVLLPALWIGFVGVLTPPTVASDVTQVKGISVPTTKSVGSETLQLNGTGVRVFRFLAVPIKIYVAAFYAPEPLRTADAALNSPEPMQFDFTFLRSVNQSQVTEAWQKQIETSVSFSYDGFERDRDAFIAMFGPIKSGGTETVRLIGDNTVVIDQGEEKGTIQGRNFQKAFLSMWFGENAVDESLKAGLLGN